MSSTSPAVNPSPGFQRHPEHTITVSPLDQPVTVTFHDTVVASSENARLLREAGYPPVIYIPFADIHFENLTRTATTTHCPFKGDASYWRVSAAGEAANDAMWAYQEPYDEMAEIKDHGAFDPGMVTIKTT